MCGIVKSIEYLFSQLAIQNTFILTIRYLYIIELMWKEVKELRQSKFLTRNRIDKELENIFYYPLTIVSAAMGYGKTTSVENYLIGCKARIIWVSVLSSDGSEVVFWKKFGEAFKKIDKLAGEKLMKSSFPMDALQIEETIDIIKKMDYENDAVLVIDDYHIIEENDKVEKLIERIVQAKIDGLHVVLTSRTKPKLNYINFVSKGMCYFIGNDILQFNKKEIKEYFELMKFHITYKDIDKIYDYTNGWISGIYLIMLGLKNGLPAVEISEVNRLVQDNLYHNFNDETKKVLLELSIFDNFTMNEAVMVLQNPKVPKILESLMAENAFIQFNRETGFYKIHNVLLDFLRKELKINNMDVKDIYYRAGKWFVKQNQMIEAFQYYHRAGKIEELLNITNTMEKINMSYCGFEVFYDICEEMPYNLYKKYPYAFLKFASSFIISGNRKLAKYGVKLVNDMRKYYENKSELSESIRNRILGEIEVISIFVAFNDSKKISEHAKKAYELFEGGISRLILRKAEFTFGVPHCLYIYYREPGKFKETIDSMTGISTLVLDGSGAGSRYIVRAEYALETYNLEKVEFYAQKAIYEAKTKMQIGIMLCANFTVIRLYIIRGEIFEARRLLIETKDLLSVFREEISIESAAVYSTTIALCEGYIYGCLNERDKIPQWLCNGDMSFGTFMYNGIAFQYIVYGKAVMLSENWIELETLCESFKDKFNLFHNQLGLLHNLIYKATAKRNLYGIKAGTKILLKALKEAEKDKIILPFVENADYILPMLYEAKNKNEIDEAYLEHIIESSEHYSKTIKRMKNNGSLLTKRETEVLKLLAEGLTRAEISSELCISISAVKRYIEGIYKKLNVNNKISAVLSARKLNIL